MKSIYSVMTRNCNVACRHCYLSAGPGKNETLSLENLEKIIKNLGGEKIIWTLTGGEIFTLGDKLFDYLRIIRSNHEKDIIKLQTNGFWINKKDAKKIVNKLKKYNLFWINFPSNADPFHIEQGIPFYNDSKLSRTLGKIPFLTKDYLHFDPKHPIEFMPVGRGGKSWKGHYDCEDNCTFNLNRKSFTMDWNGNISLCCFGFFRIGNLIEESFSKIMQRTKNSDFIKKCNYKGIKIIAKYFGMKKKEINERIKVHGTGGLCADLNREGLIPYEHRRIFETK